MTNTRLDRVMSSQRLAIFANLAAAATFAGSVCLCVLGML